MLFQIIDECNTQVGKMRQMEELIHISQTLEFDKLKVQKTATNKHKSCFFSLNCSLFPPGHPNHLPDTISGEEGGATRNGQRRNYLQHEDEIQPHLPLPLQRSAYHHRQERVSLPKATGLRDVSIIVTTKECQLVSSFT